MTNTFVRTAVWEGNLGDIVDGYRKDFMRLADVVNTPKKFAVYDQSDKANPYLFIISHMPGKHHPVYGHNLILTISSDSLLTNRQSLKNFRDFSKIDLVRPHADFVKFMQPAGLAFEVCKIRGPSILEIVKYIPNPNWN